MQSRIRGWVAKGSSFWQKSVLGAKADSASAPRRPAANYAQVDQIPLREDSRVDWEDGDEAPAASSPGGPANWTQDDVPELAPDKQLASTGKSFINALLCFFGSGCLGLPYAAERVGLVAGLVLLWAIALCSLHCMLLLVDCRQHILATFEAAEGQELEKITADISSPSAKESGNAAGNAMKQGATRQSDVALRTYGDIGFHAFGRIGNALVDSCIVLTQTGFGTAYLIFISFNLHDMYPDISVSTFLWMCVPILTALCWLPSLKYLAPFSLVAEAALLVALCAIFFVDIEEMLEAQEELEEEERAAGAVAFGHTIAAMRNVSWAYMSGVPFFFGVAVYCYEGVGMVLPVLNSMAEPARFKTVWSAALIAVTTVYSLFAFAGVAAFGPSVSDIITKNLPRGSVVTALVKLGLCVGLYFTYPLMLFPVFELWDLQLERSYGPRGCPAPLKHHLFRFSYVLLTVVLAAAIPNFGVFISLVGASASAALAFVLPAAFHLKLRWKALSLWCRVRDLACILVGVLGGVVGTLFALRDAADVMFEHPPDAPAPAAALLAAAANATVGGVNATGEAGGNVTGTLLAAP